MRAGWRRFEVGRVATATDPRTLRAAVAELVATAIFVFAAEGSTLSFGRLYHDKGMVSGLVAVALAAAVACTVNISGGHVNPAITFGAFLGGRMCLVRSLVYWTAQLLGAVTAAVLLRLATGGGRLPEYALAGGVNGWQATVLEATMAFGLMYAYYVTVMEPRRGRSGAVAPPLAVGLLAGANVLACGAFDGAVMNPARAFGPAIVGSRRWSNHWVYWAGPMVGAGLSAVVYEHFLVIPVIPANEEEPVAPKRSSSRRA